MVSEPLVLYRLEIFIGKTAMLQPAWISLGQMSTFAKILLIHVVALKQTLAASDLFVQTQV